MYRKQVDLVQFLLDWQTNQRREMLMTRYVDFLVFI